MFFAWGREFLKKGEKRGEKKEISLTKAQKHEELHEMSPRGDSKTANVKQHIIALHYITLMHCTALAW
jgi:hypothetical protein